MQFSHAPLKKLPRPLGRRLSRAGSVPCHTARAPTGAGGGRGQSMVIAALDVSILTFTFSRKTNADHPVAVPLRAGVCRADPGRVADGSQGLG